MKKVVIKIVIILSIFSCGDNTNQVIEENFNLSVKSKNAMEIYKQAKLKAERGDYIGSKADYEAALRIEPDFIMALLDINENNIIKKKRYLDKAYNNYENATPSEKIFIDLSKRGITRDETEILLKKLIELNPENSEAYGRLGFFYGSRNEKKRDEFFSKALEKNQNNLGVRREIFRNRYLSNYFAEGGMKDYNFFKFPDSVKAFENQINKLISLDSLNVSIYRDIGDRYRQSTLYLTRARDYYLRGVEVANLEGNSYRSELLHTAGNASFLLDEKEIAFNYYNESLEVEFDPFLKMKRIYQLTTAYFFDQDYVNSIATLNNFENQLKTFGFNQSEIIQAMVSIYWYKSQIYAMMGNSNESFKSWEIFEQNSQELLKEVNDIGELIRDRNRKFGNVASGLNDRIARAETLIRERDFIELNILNNNLNKAKSLIKISNQSDENKKTFSFLISCINNNFKEATEFLKLDFEPLNNREINRFLIRFHYGNLLLRNGKIDEGKKILTDISDIRGFGFVVGYVKKESKKILSNL